MFPSSCIGGNEGASALHASERACYAVQSALATSNKKPLTGGFVLTDRSVAHSAETGRERSIQKRTFVSPADVIESLIKSL